MKERPILFSSPMVRAILEGRKTQTRRIIKPQPSPEGLRKLTDGDIAATELDPSLWYGSDPFTEAFKCPYGVPGDRLWVRETWLRTDGMTSVPDTFYRASESALNAEQLAPWKPSIFMPRWASRITLEIEDVRVERLIEITAEDCIAEGVQCRESWTMDGPSGLPWLQPEGAYRELWESINGPGSWDANPYVWVIKLRRITP